MCWIYAYLVISRLAAIENPNHFWRFPIQVKMRTFIIFGGIAAGIIYYVYQLYANRENQYQYGPGGDGAHSSDEEYIIVPSTKSKSKQKGKHSLTKDDICGICLDPLLRSDCNDRAYSIIALPKCQHWFHQKCAIRLMEYHPLCPVCREPIDREALRSTPVRLESSSTTSDHCTRLKPQFSNFRGQ